MSDDESADHLPGDDDKPLGRDDRVSLWPLSFEEAVRALLRTPPIQKRPKNQ